MISMPNPSKRLLPVNSIAESFSIPYGGFCERFFFFILSFALLTFSKFAYNSREHDERSIEELVAVDAA